MHICIDENSRYDESLVEWHYFKKTIIEKKTKHGKKQLIDWWKNIDFI